MAEDIPVLIVEALVDQEPDPVIQALIDEPRKCPACGGTDHLRRSSKKCPHYKGRAAKGKKNDGGKKDAAASDPAAGVIEDGNSTETEQDSTTKNDNNETIKETNLIATKDVILDCDISKPNFIRLETGTNLDTSIYKPVVDVSKDDFKIVDTVFKVTGKDHRNRTIHIEALPHVLFEKYFTEAFMVKFVNSTNEYIDVRRKEHPSLYCWKEKKVSAHVTLSNMFHFVGILFYFGIAVMPSKSDYWSTKEWMPSHSIVTEFGMTRRRFEFIWRHFHPSFKQDEEDQEGENDEDNESEEQEMSDEDLITIGLERIHLDPNNVDGDDEEEEMDDEEVSQQSTQKKVWYNKLTWVIDHIRDVSQQFVFVLGTTLSLDEMMIRFFGRSVETHRMKNKPIKEGYNFFVLATKEGYVLNFTPDGRTAERKGEQEYDEDKKTGKVETMILFLIKIIDELKQKQLTRLQNNKEKRNTRQNEETLFEDVKMDKFCLAMDNYFTLPKVLKALREAGIGIVGTARFRGHGWPP